MKVLLLNKQNVKKTNEVWNHRIQLNHPTSTPNDVCYSNILLGKF